MRIAKSPCVGAVYFCYPQSATSSAAAAADGGSSAAGPHHGRERDLPPAFDGGDPLAFKRYEKDLQLWQFDTEVPKEKHRVHMIRCLTGPARAAADEVPLNVLTSEEGAKAIAAKLKEHFPPFLEYSLPRAFEKAVYAEARKAKETTLYHQNGCSFQQPEG